MIDKQLAEFLEAGLAIHLGTRNARFEPNGGRVAAVRVEEDGEHLVVYVPNAVAPPLLADLESNGQAAIVFCRVADERSCQIKGTFVAQRPAEDDEQPFVSGQWNHFRDNLAIIGLPQVMTAAWPMWPCVAVRVKATTLFNQTPGPTAGAKLT